MKYLKNLIGTLVLLLLDIVWVYFFMTKKYSDQILEIQGSKMIPKYYFVVAAYVLMVVGLNVFVISNIRDHNELKDSLCYGLLFGLIVYGVYDFTAAAVISQWNIKLALIDILWGSFVFFISAYVGAKMSRVLVAN